MSRSIKSNSQRERAILFMVLSSFSFTIMQSAVKLLGSDFPVVEKVFFRNLISLIIAGIIVIRSGGRFWGNSLKSNAMLVFRSALGLSGVALIFYAISVLSIGDSSIYMRLSPFWVVLLAGVFLGEKIKAVHIYSVLLAFLGVVVVIKPGFTIESTAFYIASVAGIIASLCAAGAYTLVSKLKAYEKPETIVFFFSLFSVVATLPFTLVYGVVPSAGEWLLLLTIGGGAAAGQLLLTHSYRLGKASEVSIYNYSGILFGVLIDYVLSVTIPDYNIKPFGLSTLLGGGLITSGGFLMYFHGKKGSKK